MFYFNEKIKIKKIGRQNAKKSKFKIFYLHPINMRPSQYTKNKMGGT